MVVFNKLNIVSFKSIFKLSLDFSDLKSGLYLLEGNNDTNNFANSNGAGKSTLLDALAYTIYGTTVGIYIKKEEYQNKNTKIPLKLTLYFAVNDKDYKIERTLDTVKFWQDSKDISELTKTETEKKILDTISITKEEFFNFTYLTQSGSNFLNKTASEKFSAIREFIFGDDILQIKNKLDILIKEEKARQLKLKEQKQNLKGKVSGLMSISVVCESNIDKDVLNNIESYKQSLSNLRQQRDKKQLLIRDRLSIESKIEQLKSNIGKIKQQYSLAKENICPTCKQHLLDTTVLNKIQQEAAEIKKLGQKYKTELKNINNALNNISDIDNRQIEDLSYKIKQADQYRKQESQQNDVKEKIKQLENDIKEVELNEFNSEKTILELTNIQKYFNNIFIQDLQNAFVSEIENYLNLYCYDVFDADFSLKLSGNSLDLFVGGKPYAFFSGGERQRIDLLFVFAIKIALYDFTNKCTNLLILDESLSGSDDMAYAGTIELISNLAESANLTAILVSHKNIENYNNKLVISRYKDKTRLEVINN